VLQPSSIAGLQPVTWVARPNPDSTELPLRMVQQHAMWRLYMGYQLHVLAYM
jgi:hypothetical protein